MANLIEEYEVYQEMVSTDNGNTFRPTKKYVAKNNGYTNTCNPEYSIGLFKYRQGNKKIFNEDYIDNCDSILIKQLDGTWKTETFISNYQNIPVGDVILVFKNLTTTKLMFNEIYDLLEANLVQFDTSNVTDMNHMFANCGRLTKLEANNLDVSKVTNFRGMFFHCLSLTSLDLSNWETVMANDMDYMFYDCRSLTSLDLRKFDISNVTECRVMFGDCNKLRKIICTQDFLCKIVSVSILPDYNMDGGTFGKLGDGTNWEIVDYTKEYIVKSTIDITQTYRSFGVGDNQEAFLKIMCRGVPLDIRTSPIVTSDYLTGTQDLEYYIKPHTCTSDFSHLFRTSQANYFNFEYINTSHVTDMREMFSQCDKIRNLDLSSFNTSNVTDMHNMFYKCRLLTSLNLSSFDTSNVTDMSEMFSVCSRLTSLDLSSFNTSNVTDMHQMFASCDSLTSLDLSSFNTSNVTNMYAMFASCDSLTSLDLSSFNTSNVTDMTDMFNFCLSLTSLDLSSFNTSNVTNMHYMFYGCRSLTSLDLSSFDTSNVTDMSEMFYNCRSLTSLDLSSFDISQVNSYIAMFSSCFSLTHIKCKQAFKDWCITNQESISLPTEMKEGGKGTWEIVG